MRTEAPTKLSVRADTHGEQRAYMAIQPNDAAPRLCNVSGREVRQRYTSKTRKRDVHVIVEPLTRPPTQRRSVHTTSPFIPINGFVPVEDELEEPDGVELAELGRLRVGVGVVIATLEPPSSPSLSPFESSSPCERSVFSTAAKGIGLTWWPSCGLANTVAHSPSTRRARPERMVEWNSTGEGLNVTNLRAFHLANTPRSYIYDRGK